MVSGKQPSYHSQSKQQKSDAKSVLKIAASDPDIPYCEPGAAGQHYQEKRDRNNRSEESIRSRSFPRRWCPRLDDRKTDELTTQGCRLDPDRNIRHARVGAGNAEAGHNANVGSGKNVRRVPRPTDDSSFASSAVRTSDATVTS